MATSALFRLLLPPDLAADSGLRGVRASRFAGFLVLAAGIVAVPVAIGIATGDHSIVVKHVILLGFIAGGMLLLRRGWLDVPVTLVLAAALVTNGLGIAEAGMVGNPAVVLTPVIPMFSLLIAGRRTTILFSVLVLVELVYFGSRQASGILPASPYPVETQPGHMMTGAILFVLASLGMGAVLEAGQRHAMAKLTAANDALRDARDAAEREAVARASMLSSMSHEIRTPLHGVMGTIELVLGGALVPPQRALLRRADGAAQSLMHLLDDILDLAKLEAGRIELEALPIDLASLLDDVAHLFHAKAGKKGVRLVVARGDQAPQRVLGDENRLRQIASNLASNAVKFTDSGTVTLAIEGAPRGVRLVVSDTGCGMTPAQAARIFQPFAQAEAATARRHGGTGLGLSICCELVTLMGGELSVESTPGEGSTFTATLPLPTTEVRAAEAAPSSEAVRLDGARVLLAEDNDLNGLIVTQALTRAGCTVLRAADGAQALTILSECRVDVVLMDMYMPNLDGPSATCALRARGFSRPILGFTASATASERRRCLEAGMDQILTKPIRHAALIAAIHGVLPAAPEAEARRSG